MRDAVIGTDWTDREIDLIVADYFDMLGLELRGETFVKAQRNAALQELTGRSRGSIEFKHQNISAVLFRLCMRWIDGYKPMANSQRALVDGVERYLVQRPLLFENPVPVTRPASLSGTACPILRAAARRRFRACAARTGADRAKVRPGAARRAKPAIGQAG